MIRFLLLGVLLLLVARAFWRLVDGIIEVAGGLPDRRRVSRGPAAMRLVRDPVCGTHVPADGALQAREGDRVVYFCSERCRTEFLGRRRAG